MKMCMHLMPRYITANKEKTYQAIQLVLSVYKTSKME